MSSFWHPVHESEKEERATCRRDKDACAFIVASDMLCCCQRVGFLLSLLSIDLTVVDDQAKELLISHRNNPCSSDINSPECIS